MHRKLLKWGWYGDHATCRLFMHLLLKANHSVGIHMGVTVNAGQHKTGRKVLAHDTGLSEQQIRTSLNKLKSTSDITINAHSKYSMITITNWDNYQQFDGPSTSKATNNQPAINQQLTTNNNDNNENKDSGIEPKISKKTPARATRIPGGENWQPDDKDKDHAVKKGFHNGQIAALADGFRDHHIAASGKGSTARDWNAKWRTWIANDIKWHGNPDVQRQGKNATTNGGRGIGSVTEAFKAINLHNRNREVGSDIGGHDWPDIGDGKIIDH